MGVATLLRITSSPIPGNMLNPYHAKYVSENEAIIELLTLKNLMGLAYSKKRATTWSHNVHNYYYLHSHSAGSLGRISTGSSEGSGTPMLLNCE